MEEEGGYIISTEKDGDTYNLVSMGKSNSSGDDLEIGDTTFTWISAVQSSGANSGKATIYSLTLPTSGASALFASSAAMMAVVLAYMWAALNLWQRVQYQITQVNIKKI